MTARVVFMGTPDAALPALEGVASAHDVGLVITQPDRPRGRSRTPQPPPVRELADRLGVPVAQPTDGAGIVTALEEHGPFDVGIVVAYGRILSADVLEMPGHGFLNVHFSLLPRWRGAAPVARALMAGDEMTGVTIFRLDEGLDTGPVLTAQAVDIDSTENAGELTDRLSVLGARLVMSVIDPYLVGDLVPVAQTGEGASVAAKITAGDRPIDINTAPGRVVAQVRGLAPEPGATLLIDGERQQILGARAHLASIDPGSWAAVEGAPVVGVAGGGVEITLIKPPGRNLQSGEDWVRGHRAVQGQVE